MMSNKIESERDFTVLVVDDAADHLEISLEFLRPFYQVRTAASGLEALAQAKMLPLPDLILLDVVMPEMNGFQVLAALREAPETRDIPVIFVTAAGVEEEEHGLKRGAVDFVVKPISRATLLARVATHLALSAATRELKIQNVLLEQRVAERTQKLARAMFAAEAANRAKSEFLNNMSHELRTPMNGIIGMSDLLLNTGLDADQREFAGILKNSAKALSLVLTDILNFAKAEAEGLIVEQTVFDVRELTDKLHDLFRSRAAEKQLLCDCRVAPETPAKLMGDVAHVRQILLKLIDNALEFTDRGSVSLDVVPIGTVETGTPTLRFELRDTGIGIAANRHEAIFQPFTQVDGSVTRRHGGLGLGLAATRHLVELMNGKIGVESQEGSGSLFWVELPFRLAEVG
jgi:signal transduction histidine kinase